jgi:hypothetical protein
MVMTAVIIDTVRAIDEIFIQLAEADGDPALPIDDVVEELWAMLALGDIRLTVEGNRLRVELLPERRGVAKRPERMRLARQVRPIVEARLRVLEGRL